MRNDRTELAGDAVARREVTARLATLQSQLEAELHRTFDAATWFRKHHEPKSCRHAALNSLASNLADKRFSKSPCLHNELLNRQKPSGSAIAAQNLLLRLMVLKEGEPRLGIEGFPAEGGLFASVLEGPGLYRKTRGGFHFTSPRDAHDLSRLVPIWSAAEEFLRGRSSRAVSVSEPVSLGESRHLASKTGLCPCWRWPSFFRSATALPSIEMAFFAHVSTMWTWIT